MRGRTVGGILAEGPAPVGVGICAPAGHASASAETAAAQAIAIGHARDIAVILAHPRVFAKMESAPTTPIRATLAPWPISHPIRWRGGR